MISALLHTSNRFAQAKVDCLGDRCNTSLPQVDLGNDQVQIILQFVFGAIAAVALIIIIVSALQLIASQGDPKALGRQRDTLIYASIGLAIALSAEIIVTFVLGNV